MKKFYAFCAAALMSASMFAAAPTVAELAETYNVNDNVVLCVHFIEDAEVCNAIYFVGPVSWDENFDNHPQFKAVPNHEGWYAAQAPYAEGIQGKPLQAKKDGSFSWDYQSGDPDAWVKAESDGKTMNISAGYDGEANISYPEAGAYIYELKYWKNHKSPCVFTPSHDYKIVLYAPACEKEEYIPGIIGDFNSWGASDAMNADLDLEGNDCWTYTIHDEEGHAFKFREAGISDWSNQILVYNAEDDEYKDGPNISLPAALNDTVLVIDYSDPEIYSWTKCQEPVDSTVYKVVVSVKVPENAPAAGVELMGDFGEDTWNTGIVMQPGPGDPGWFVTYDVEAAAYNQFKFREAGNPDWNEIVYVEKVKDGKPVGLPNFKFGKLWTDETHKLQPVKWIEIDLSDPKVYVWKADWVEPEGIENVVLTEKAQKVVVDGVLYIIRDNKMFNVQGTQVR